MKNKIKKILTVLLIFSFIVTISGASALTASAATSRTKSVSFWAEYNGSNVAKFTANFTYDRTTSKAISGKITWINNERYTYLTSSVRRVSDKIIYDVRFRDEITGNTIGLDYTAFCAPNGIVSWY